MLKVLFIIFLFFCSVYIALGVYASKYASPYYLITIFGKKGVGKSSDIVKRSLAFKRKGYRVFCNDRDITTCEYYDSSDFGKFAVPNSVIFLDEAGLVFHKRDSLDKNNQQHIKIAREFVKLIRHYRVTVIIYSQSWDIDLSLKENCDFMYYYRKVFNVFTVGRRISKSIVLTQPQADRPGSMFDSYAFDSIFSKGGLIVNFIPKYAKYYNSFNQTTLPTYNEFYHIPEQNEAIDATSES